MQGSRALAGLLLWGKWGLQGCCFGVRGGLNLYGDFKHLQGLTSSAATRSSGIFALPWKTLTLTEAFGLAGR